MGRVAVGVGSVLVVWLGMTTDPVARPGEMSAKPTISVLTLSPQTPAPVLATAQTVRWALRSDVQLTLHDQKQMLLVDVAGATVPEFKGTVPQRPSGDGLQVWVLRTDGTALRRRSPLRADQWASMGGYATKSWTLTFEYAPFRELAGIAVGVEGQLYVRELPHSR